jgi:predicted nuclease with TOPRIM domain
MANIFQKLFGKRKSLRQRVKDLEKRLEELEQKPVQDEDNERVSFSQVVDEWLNGKEGADE